MINQQKLNREQELADMREVLGLPAGRRLIRRLLSLSNCLGPSFVADTHSTAFNEGLRQMGIVLLKDVGECSPEQGGLPNLIADLINPIETRKEKNNE